MVTELSTRPVTATGAPHQCEWCGREIPAGSPAVYRAYTFDGDFMAGYMDPECRQAMLDYDHSQLPEGWNPGDFARGRTDDRHDLPAEFNGKGAA